MKYIVAKINGKQYLLKEGEDVLVDKIKDKIDPKVMLYVDDGKVKIGKPYLSNVKLSLSVEEQVVKGKKVDVRKFKAKSRYRRAIGFRPQLTKVTLQKIK